MTNVSCLRHWEIASRAKPMGPSLHWNIFSSCRSAPGLPFASEVGFSLRKGASAPQLSLPHKAMMDSLSPLEGLPQADLGILLDSISPLEGLPRVDVEISMDSLSPFEGLPGKLLLTALKLCYYDNKAVNMAWHGMAWDSMILITPQHDGMAQHGMEWNGTTGYSSHHSMTAWPSMAWHRMGQHDTHHTAA